MDFKVKKICSDIKRLRIQGAQNVALAAVKALELTAQNAKKEHSIYRDMETLGKTLVQLRPTEPALRNAVDYILHQSKKCKHNPRVQILALCVDYEKKMLDAQRKLAEMGAQVIENKDVILTHCHSSSVINILKKAKQEKKKFTVIVTETRPFNQGLITAKDLDDAGITYTYVVDSAAAFYMPSATKVLVGADAITAEGDVVNKIGTELLALAAKHWKVPFYVATPSYKFDPATIGGKDEPIEFRDPEEIEQPKIFKHGKIENPAFDVTIAPLIDRIITEKGILIPSHFVELMLHERD